ncbi:MAG: hypothetical protein KKH91_03785 [Elusimicrobia bacterium]|nr:hypothetical protein [Elusimicrobiota bacterium]
MKRCYLLTCIILIASICLGATQKQIKTQKDPDTEFKEKSPNIYKLIKLNWIDTANKEEFLKYIQDINTVNALIVDILPKVKNDGTAIIPQNLWENTPKEIQDFGFALIGYYTDVKRLPIFYQNSLKKLRVIYENNSTNPTIMKDSEQKLKNDLVIRDVYLLLAMECACEKNYIEANKMMNKIADVPNGRIITVQGFIDNKGMPVYYSTFKEIKYQSKKTKGTLVKFEITVYNIIAGEEKNLMLGILGDFASSRPKSYPRQVLDWPDQALIEPDIGKLTIEIPEELFEQMSFRKGEVITVYGKANGLFYWNDVIGNIPLIKANKIEKIER